MPGGNDPLQAVERLQQRLRAAYAQVNQAHVLRVRIVELEQDVERMRGELDARYRELATLERLLEGAADLSPAQGQSRQPGGINPGARLHGLLKRWNGHGRRRRDMRRIEASGLFDRRWYIENYPDVAAAGIDPLEHYLEFGAAEGREVGRGFSVRDYLKRHPSAAGCNPLLHFLDGRGRNGNGEAGA